MLITLLILAILISFFVHTLLLNWTTKMFKIEKANYKTSLKISVFEWLLAIIVGLIISFIFIAIKLPNLLTNIVFTILVFFILHWLLKKYYSTQLKKNILIYIVLTIMFVVVSLVVTIPMRMFIMQPFYASGESMMPTIEKGEYVLIKVYDKNFQRGDIIVYQYPNKPEQRFIHRIVGMPGEKIQIKDGRVYIYNNDHSNGYELPENYLLADTKTSSMNQEIINIKEGQYFVLGDNRNQGLDSRAFGLLDKKLIIGKYWISPPLR